MRIQSFAVYIPVHRVHRAWTFAVNTQPCLITLLSSVRKSGVEKKDVKLTLLFSEGRRGRARARLRRGRSLNIVLLLLQSQHSAGAGVGQQTCGVSLSVGDYWLCWGICGGGPCCRKWTPIPDKAITLCTPVCTFWHTQNFIVILRFYEMALTCGKGLAKKGQYQKSNNENNAFMCRCTHVHTIVFRYQRIG